MLYITPLTALRALLTVQKRRSTVGRGTARRWRAGDVGGGYVYVYIYICIYNYIYI